MSGELILLLGGARAGKSTAAERLAERLAEQRAQRGGRVLFIATAQALDAEMERRIAAHRAQRPAGWARGWCRRGRSGEPTATRSAG